MHARQEPPGITRRRFHQLVAGAAAFGLVEAPRAARLLGYTDRLSWRANRTAGREGVWQLDDIEGELPEELVGTLYRTAPGESERFGTTFGHLFDGDAFLSGYSFRDGGVTLRAQFLAQPERLEERRGNAMTWSEFGTKAPGAGKPRYKNQPSVNVIAWDGRLLGLSEGGHPTAIDPQTFACGDEWDFHGTLPGQHTFTAHPKFDRDGTGYCYGIVQGMGMALRVYRMEPNGELTLLHEMMQRGYFMVHDMVLTEEHVVFLIPPVTYDLGQLLSGRATPGDALRYAESRPLRIVAVRKDGTGEPVEVETDPAMVFHHGNAFERDGRLHIDSVLYPDGGILAQLHAWARDELPEAAAARATRLVVDLGEGAVVARDVFAEHVEFPRFDTRSTGGDARYLYAAGRPPATDPLAFRALLRCDRRDGREQALEVAAHQTVAEPVFVPRRDDAPADQGFLLQLGYDGRRDETFLDVVDAEAMARLARIWTGTHLPLGFHGNFARDLFVAG